MGHFLGGQIVKEINEEFVTRIADRDLFSLGYQEIIVQVS